MTEGLRNRPRGAESGRLNFLPPALPSESPSFVSEFELPILSQSSSACSSERRPLARWCHQRELPHFLIALGIS